MNNSDFPELSDIPRLLASGRIVFILQARSVILDAADKLISASVSECRAMRPDEKKHFDNYTSQFRQLTDRLEELADHRQREICAPAASPLFKD